MSTAARRTGTRLGTEAERTSSRASVSRWSRRSSCITERTVPASTASASSTLAGPNASAKKASARACSASPSAAKWPTKRMTSQASPSLSLVRLVVGRSDRSRAAGGGCATVEGARETTRWANLLADNVRGPLRKVRRRSGTRRGKCHPSSVPQRPERVGWGWTMDGPSPVGPICPASNVRVCLARATASAAELGVS
jgi:hypothetical protein